MHHLVGGCALLQLRAGEGLVGYSRQGWAAAGTARLHAWLSLQCSCLQQKQPVSVHSLRLLL